MDAARSLRQPIYAHVLAIFLILSSVTMRSLAQQAEKEVLPDSHREPLTLSTTVRRVVVDVVVTDSKGKAVPALTREEFSLTDNGAPQRILSFEPNGFSEGMDYTPPKLPDEPPNTFVNLPSTPETGPLYVLLYDLVNMDNEDQMEQTAQQHGDQMRGQQQLLKFIQSKPEGTRFALYVLSDGLHLLQGFTADKAELYAAINRLPFRVRGHALPRPLRCCDLRHRRLLLSLVASRLRASTAAWCC